MFKGDKKQLFKHIRLIMCCLLLAFSLSSCKMVSAFQGKSQGEDAAAMEKAANDCWTCSLFDLAFEVANSTAQSIVRATAGSAISLLAVGFAIWLGIHILKFVSSLKEPDSAGFWKDLAIRAFWVTMCAGLLRDLQSVNESSVIKLVLEPIFSGFVDFGLMVVSSLPGDGSIPCPTGDPQAGITCLIAALQQKLNVGMATSLLAVLLGGPFVILIGLGIYAVSAIMMLYFPILLLDCVFRYGLLTCMLPLFVVAYCFPVTRDVCGKGMKALIEIGMQIIGMCVFVAICVTVIHKYIEDFIPYLKDPFFFVNDIAALEKVMYGPGLTGFVFVAFFLVLFGGVLFEMLKKFGGMGGGGKMVEGAMHGARNMGKAAQKVGRFANNRKNRALDKKAKKTLEQAKRDGFKRDDKGKLRDKNNKEVSEKDAAKFEAAKDRLERRGFLKEDGNGKLQETRAYKNMDKRGARESLKNLSTDWAASSSDQRGARYDDSNKMTGDTVP